MQYFALDEHEKTVAAHLAEKGKDYTCPACGDALRKRLSFRKRAHFYHPKRTVSCSHREKSHAHIALQQHLLQTLPPGEMHLEYRFKEISRIADVAWPSKGLVFEIQCSPISVEEVHARNRAYNSIGMEIVWILYDKTFNRRTLSAAEGELRRGLCYYTDGEKIYDQAELVQKNRRLYRSIPYTVNLASPKLHDHALPAKGPLYFPGDVTDKSLRYPQYREWLANLEKPRKKIGVNPVSWLLEKIYLYTHPMQSFFCINTASTRGNTKKSQKPRGGARPF